MAKTLIYKETWQIWEIIQIAGANIAQTRADGVKPYNLSELGFSICKMGIIISHAVDVRAHSSSVGRMLTAKHRNLTSNQLIPNPSVLGSSDR